MIDSATVPEARCLRCGSVLTGRFAAARTCRRCGARDLPSLRRFGRARIPRLREVQRRARTVVAATSFVLLLSIPALSAPLGYWPGVLMLGAVCCALSLFVAIGRMQGRRSLIGPAVCGAVSLLVPALLILPPLGAGFRAEPAASWIAGVVTLAGSGFLLLLARHWHRLRKRLLASPPPGGAAPDVEVAGPLRCLRCRRVLPPEQGKDHRCPACGLANAPWQRRAYWTLDPRLVHLERIVKAAVVLLCIGLGAFILLNIPSMSGPGGGFAPALALALAVALWQTASKITRHEVLFGAALFWRLVFWLPAAVLLPFSAVAAWTLVRDGTSSWAQDGRIHLLAAEAGLALAGLGVHLAARRLERWKRHRLRQAA